MNQPFPPEDFNGYINSVVTRLDSALGAGMGLGALSSVFNSQYINQASVSSVVNRLSKMRGAALKLGQMISIQDNTYPPEIQDIMRRVQNQAHFMPNSQLNSVMAHELGPNWLALFESFEEKPFAAASIGQVHKATLQNKTPVVVKIQYPGVQESIDSDLNNLKLMLNIGNLLPKGLYLDNTIRVARTELKFECDYVREAAAQDRFLNILTQYRLEGFAVAKVFKNLSTSKVLTMEFLQGFPIDKAVTCSQQIRNSVPVFNVAWRETF
jgi:aarF domain-containing kinase